ncbi:hypothetical protein ElyMa_002708400 [Elysia marginata]|uniref:Uncharacterized protein n=1 Tax=Elysia marginata TaxID=1093978 RepID=A0AAV4HE09_9GAST|nr:hypothetical protein ElyMa_002708400 [Elysia marginata]
MTVKRRAQQSPSHDWVEMINILIRGQRGGVVSASDSRSGGRGFDSRPCHVAIALGKQFTLTFPVRPPVKWVPSYRLHMYWSAGALGALLCGDTVTLSNEDKSPERD